MALYNHFDFCNERTGLKGKPVNFGILLVKS
jgi:hypothetical protein